MHCTGYLSKLNQISLSLSGGGTRAMAFHAGVLLFLSEKGLLENIKKISTVSGGSLLTGLIFRENNYRWPSSEEYKGSIYGSIRNQMCSRDLKLDTIKMLLQPRNLQYLFTRANLLAKALYENWDIKSTINELPLHPEWSINGTTAETGKRFRFKKDSIGDYTLGYASADKFLLADAMSVSAAFPGLIGPYTLKTKQYRWFKNDWGQVESTGQTVELADTLRIYDGGVYDNLGLESFYDQGRNIPKDKNDFIICSDAGAPLKYGFSYADLNPWRLKRVMDIMSEQSRALRIRSFMNYLFLNKNSGLYIGITDSELINKEFENHPKNHPTNLNKFSEKDFDYISSFGFDVAKKNFTNYIQ